MRVSAIAEDPDNPRYEGARFMGTSGRSGGALISREFGTSVASELGKEAAI